MKETGIIMSGDHPTKILDGTKTMTRRVIIPQPDLLYGAYGGIIQVIHNDLDREDNDGELDIKANTSITERQLYGGERWEDIFKNKIQRLREEGFSGLVSISRTRHGKERIFSGFLMPQQYQGNTIGSPPSMYGFSRDASQEVYASETSGRKLAQQQAREPEVGDSIRELAGQADAQSAQSLLQQSKFKDILRGKRAYPLGSEKGNSKRATHRENFRDEPIVNIRNLPWCVGQRLWVRETWCQDWDMNGVTKSVVYKASAHPSAGFTWQSSRFMPRWASRITLEITSLKVERVQEITEEDCKLEGTPELGWTEDGSWKQPRYCFEWLWDSLNAKRGYSWESNPWVWVIGFKICR